MIAKEFVVPKWVKVEDGATEQYARFVIEPFERGYGTTIGNSLRRVLLASLEGAAVTAIRIEGVQHEFSSIPGVKEDMTDVVLNLKQCQLRLNREEPLIFSFSHKGSGEVTSGDLFKDTEVDVLNPEQPIFTSTAKSTDIEMEVKVARGRGYVTAENFELEHAPLGTVYLDASFSPVTKVNFFVEDARVGQTTDYDRLLLDVWTNGSISPEKAIEEAAQLLVDHLKIFVKQEAAASEEAAGGAGEDPELMRALSRPVEELELSVRAANCLRAANIRLIRDLVVRTEPEMLQFHNFGKKSLDEIKAILESMNLSLGMDLGDPKEEGTKTLSTQAAKDQ
ncbi:MAG TPA: DNA-directed RNA polymerase subunit alpha [Candidatus Hydrogenedentes bacterium]|nr:DNA-directed RNA polymerase subunit alpha [Candidatus Hydrogenedentota bacterium]